MSPDATCEAQSPDVVCLETFIKMYIAFIIFLLSGQNSMSLDSQ